MKIGILKVKVERNNLIKYSNKYYIDETSDIIKELNLQGKSALLGIQNKKGVYTIIGEQFIYYLTSSGKRGEISLKEFSDELHENGCLIGKGFLNYKLKFMYKNIVLSNNDKVWLYNSNTMFSLWNTILWLQKNW
jgi:hypothetical protein